MEPRAALDELAEAAVLRGLPDAVVVIDREGFLLWGNAATDRLFGWPFQTWVGESSIELVHPDDLEMALLSLESVKGKEVGTPIEVRVKTSGGWKLVELVGSPIGDDQIALVLRDLTDRRRWEVAQGDDAKFRTLVHNSASLTLLVTPNGLIQSISASICRMLGLDPEQLEGTPLVDLAHPEDRHLLKAALVVSRSEERRPNQPPVTAEVRLKQRARTATVPFELTIVNLIDDPTVGGFVVSGHDITRLRAAQEKLEVLARRDALTGLPNRSSLDTYLSDVLQARRRVAVAFLDLDRFKPVNDLLGHDAGDELLRQLGRRLTAEMRGRDFVARFGGDEFVVVAEIGEAEIAGLIERIEDVVARPFELPAGPAQVFASVGVAISNDGHTAESLLSEADAAMYAVKRARRGGGNEGPGLTVADRRKLSEDLTAALSDNQFEVHYQPIWRLRGESLWGYEALVRWRHPTKGLLLPGEFLDVVEDSGRDSDMGEMVLRAACGFAVAFAPAGTTVAVNVSAGQIASQAFAELVGAILSESGLAASRLCLEISERNVLARPAQGPSTPLRRNLELLSMLGVQLAIDDFGTGYSSLTHVLQFPVSQLKIDRSFVQEMVTDRQSHSVVAALVELARGMGIEAIAEGVETTEQLRALQEIGCPGAQGFLLGRPSAPSPNIPSMGKTA